MSSAKRPGPQSAAKRLLHELATFREEGNPALLELGPASEHELTRWSAVMKGPTGSAYEGGVWKLEVTTPATYPLAAPAVKFVTPICHPNVHFRTGEICLDLLRGSWSPAYTISATLSAVQQLLTSAEPDSPLNVDVAQLFRAGDAVGAESLIRYYVEAERYGREG